MERYKNNNKNSNRKNIFERISKFKKVKNELRYRINVLEEKIEDLSGQSSSVFRKKDFSVSDYADLQTQINSYQKDLNRYYERLNKLNPVAKKLKKICLKIGAGIVAGSITIGGFVAGLKHSTKDNTPTEPTTSISEQTKESTTQDSYSDLDSNDAILKDFKQRYVEDYNKKHGTSISASSIQLIGSNLQWLYKTHDGQYVTHGSLPYETEKILDSYGDYETIGINYNGTVYQILLNGTPLESHAVALYKDSSGKMQSIDTTILSGNDLDTLLDNLKNKNGLSKTILEDLSPLPEYVVSANTDYHDEHSKMYYVHEYKKSAKELDNQKEPPAVSTIQESSNLDYDKLVETIGTNFMDLYAKPNRTPEEQKKLENYAAEIIEKTNYLEAQLFERLNKQELERLNSPEDPYNHIDEIVSVDAYLFNYSAGSYNPVVSYNSKEPVFSNNDGTILATSVVSKNYSDNIALANARLAAYVLQSMDSNVIKDACISKNKDGKSQYNFNLSNNIKFRAAAKEVFKNNIRVYEDDYRINS